MSWTQEELDSIDRSDEFEISSYRPDGTLRPFVTIWAVRTGDDVYVRSAYGRGNGWFRRALASGTGRLRTNGVEKDISFEEPNDDVHPILDTAYHAKYDRYGQAIVSTVTGEHSRGETFHLIPQE